MSFETMAAAEAMAIREQMDRIDARILALYRSERDRAGEASRRAYEYVRSHEAMRAGDTVTVDDFFGRGPRTLTIIEAEPPSEHWRRGVYPLSVGG